LQYNSKWKFGPELLVGQREGGKRGENMKKSNNMQMMTRPTASLLVLANMTIG
jgi:hypothetical protein